MKNKIVLIGGGSASGKTLISKALKDIYQDDLLIINIDLFCKGHQELSLEDREKINYDEPSAYEHELLIKNLKELMSNHEVDLPTYDFAKHLRSEEKIHVKPAKIILIDGIFALYYQELLDIANLKIYVDALEDVRLNRRINRDIKERGRNKESVLKQFHDTVKPMHDLYIEPCKYNADIVIENNGNEGINKDILDKIIPLIENL